MLPCALRGLLGERVLVFAHMCAARCVCVCPSLCCRGAVLAALLAAVTCGVATGSCPRAVPDVRTPAPGADAITVRAWYYHRPHAVVRQGRRCHRREPCASHTPDAAVGVPAPPCREQVPHGAASSSALWALLRVVGGPGCVHGRRRAVRIPQVVAGDTFWREGGAQLQPSA